jgi:hypothetical protein
MKAIAPVLAITVAALSCEPVQAACVAPNAEALVGQDLVGCCKVISSSLGGASAGLRWVAASWEGPADGTLYVVNCDGVKVAELDSLGYVERLVPAPRIGGIPTVAVTHIPATGTSIKLRSVALVQYRAGKVRVIWEHATLDAAYPPASLGPSYEERTSWRFLEGHSRIEAITVRTLFGKSRRTVKLPAERYCLRASVRHYVPCD